MATSGGGGGSQSSLSPCTARIRTQPPLQLSSLSSGGGETLNPSSPTPPPNSKCSNNPNESLVKNIFDDNGEKLQTVRRVMAQYRFRWKNFSTADISLAAAIDGHVGFGQYSSATDNDESPWYAAPVTDTICPPSIYRPYLSDCNLVQYYRHAGGGGGKDDRCCGGGGRVATGNIRDYITYSCSTLAICGDTIHSSQLPSPQAQSFRQLNSSLLFSDLDVARTCNRKAVNYSVKRRLQEFTRTVGQSTLTVDQISNIERLANDVIVKPLKMAGQYWRGQQFWRQEEDADDQQDGPILINVMNYEQEMDHDDVDPEPVKFTKRDKEMFVLNWLQTTVDPVSVSMMEQSN